MSSILTFPTTLRTTSIVLAARLVPRTLALHTPTLPLPTPSKLRSLSRCSRRPTSPSTQGSMTCSSWQGQCSNLNVSWWALFRVIAHHTNLICRVKWLVGLNVSWWALFRVIAHTTLVCRVKFYIWSKCVLVGII